MYNSSDRFRRLGENRYIVFDIIECVIGIMGSCTNIMVLVAISKERRLRTITNCFVGSLAASDVLVGLVVPPLVILSNEGLQISFLLCVFSNSLVVLLTNISVLNLLSVALERFVAIREPFMYQRWMSIHRALYLVVATWLVAIFIGLVPLMGWNNGREGYKRCSFTNVISLEYLVYFIFFAITLPPLIAMASIYFYIFSVVRRTKRMTEALVMSQGIDRVKRTMKKNTRGDVSILLVILLFTLCWMPLHFTNSILLFSNIHVPTEIYLTCNTLSRFNSLVNPFLFAFGYSRFKVTIKKILFKRCFNIEEEVSDVPEFFVQKRITRTSDNMDATVLFAPNSIENPRCMQSLMKEICKEIHPKPDVKNVDVVNDDAMNVLDLPEISPTEPSNQEATARTNLMGALNGAFAQSWSENSCLCSIIDMMSDEIVSELGIYDDKASEGTFNNLVTNSRSSHIGRAPKTISILDNILSRQSPTASEHVATISSSSFQPWQPEQHDILHKASFHLFSGTTSSSSSSASQTSRVSDRLQKTPTDME